MKRTPFLYWICNWLNLLSGNQPQNLKFWGQLITKIITYISQHELNLNFKQRPHLIQLFLEIHSYLDFSLGCRSNQYMQWYRLRLKMCLFQTMLVVCTKIRQTKVWNIWVHFLSSRRFFSHVYKIRCIYQRSGGGLRCHIPAAHLFAECTNNVYWREYLHEKMRPECRVQEITELDV